MSMDKGAARSRKRAEQLAKAESSVSAGDNPVLKRLAEGEARGGRGGRGGPGGGGFRGRGGRGGRGGREGFGSRNDPHSRPAHDTGAAEAESSEMGGASTSTSRPTWRKKEMLDEAVRYKPKAIRTAAALIWSEGAFDLPPSEERMENVRRVDLSGSGVTDVSWIKGGVTWLSLAGCPVEQGWEAVGELKELSVLNISGCGLKALPPSLAGLTNLKAIVAMNNDWTSLDDATVGNWSSLNSLIVSHSPSLGSIPKSLSTLVHLSKLTFSHCPLLPPSALPDLSALPVLRDVKMNNLPLLSSLPKHLATWGTGDLSLVHTRTAGEDDNDDSHAGPTRSTTRQGDGLEVLDLGNCSLPYSAIEGVFIPSKSGMKPNQATWHLRSLSLHSNPLGTTHADYAERLQSSPLLPNLQIIDAKRVVERKRKGEVNESRVDKRRREKRENKMKPSGANVDGNKVMRSWGTAAEGPSGEDSDADAATAAGETADATDRQKDGSKKRKVDKVAGVGEDEAAGKKHKSDKKRRREREAIRLVDADPAHHNRHAPTGHSDKTKSKSKSGSEAVPTQTDHTTAPTSLDPSTLSTKKAKYDPTAAPSAVLKVIDVKADSDGLTPQERKIKERREAKRAAKVAAKEAAGGEAYVKQKEARRKEEEERKESELKAALGGGGVGKALGGWAEEGHGEGDAQQGDAGLGVGGW